MSHTPNRDQVRRFVEAIFAPDDIVEVRSIWPIKDVKNARQEWCRAEDIWLPNKLTLLEGFNTEGFGIYVGVNPRRNRSGSKEKDVLLARALFVDFDGNCTVEQALAKIAAAGLPEPTIVMESGHGVHVYWRLDQPLKDLKLFRAHQAALIEVLGSDPAVKDPPRVMRLPGFMNTKLPVAPTTLVICERDRVYSLDRFPIITAPERPKTMTVTVNSGSSRYGDRALADEIARVLGAKEGERNTTLCRSAFRMGQLVAAGRLDQKTTEEALVRAGIGAGLPQAEAAGVVRRAMAAGVANPRRGLSAPDVRAGLSHGMKPEAASTPRPSPEVRTKPFPVDLLPEPVRTFVIQAAKAIGCDPSYVAVPLLAALACAVGNTHVVRLKDGWDEPVILWTAIVGDSGTMKTPAFKAAVKYIRVIQKKAFKKYMDERAGWEIDQLHYETQLAAWKQKARGGRSDEEPPEKPVPPVAFRYVVSDTTVEALAPILLGNPRGVMLTRDELSGWLGSFDRYAKTGRSGGGDTAHWLSMHNGDSMTVDRKSGNPPTIFVPTASVSITGGIQPGRLAAMIGTEHRESGMLARFLFAQPPRRTKRWTEAVINPQTDEAMTALFERLCSLEMQCNPFDAADQFPAVIELSPEGKLVWIEFYNAHAEVADDLSGEDAAAWSKIEGYAARLALLVHISRWASGDSMVPTPTTPVDKKSVLAGVAMARWFGDEANRVYDAMSESTEAKFDRELENWLRRHNGITASELAHGRRDFRGNAEAARAALDRLAQQGRGEWRLAQNPNGGQATERFWLFPVVPVTATPPDTVGFGSCSDSDIHDGPPPPSTGLPEGWP